VFLSAPNAGALREQQGTRDTTPVFAEVYPFAAAACGIGVDGAFLLEAHPSR
jgi:hypothetical protein